MTLKGVKLIIIKKNSSPLYNVNNCLERKEKERKEWDKVNHDFPLDNFHIICHGRI